MDFDTLYDDLIEDVVNYEFQEDFFSKYEASKLQFYSDSLQECIKDVAESKRPLLFYLHNGNKTFSHTFYQLISNAGIENLISDNYYIMGWNINNEQLNRSKILQNETDIINSIKSFIETKEPCIFFIVPSESNVKELEKERIHGEVNEEKLITALTKIELLLSRHITQTYFNSMTSIKYQQWMYDELSDRDYDSFENNEHHLLKDKILFAMYGPPRKLEQGGIGYEEKDIKEADKVCNQIKEVNNEASKWDDRVVISFIYNCTEPLAEYKQKKIKADPDYNPDEDFYPVPVFVLRRCKKRDPESRIEPCRRFIDNNCRVYNSWNDYLEKNTMPPCNMIYPKNGKYDSNNYDDVRLENKFSPSCSAISGALRFTDIGTSVVGLASGAVFIASMFTPLAAVALPVAMIGGGTTGVYAVGRSTNTLIDRKTHKLSIGVDNAESRAAYFNIAAGTVGALGAGATAAMTNYIRNGGQLGKGIQYTVNAINGANIVTSGTATANSCVDVFRQYWEDGERPSALTLVQLSSSLFFFGNSLYNFRTAATIINETQTSSINEISESLRSNRHRKAFNKLVKESVRTQGAPKGRAEVISTIKNVGAARDDVIATLVRSNKNFNKNGIRFAASDGGITLNGAKVDILDFGNMPKTQQAVHMESLPSIPESYSSANMKSTTNVIKNMKIGNNLKSVLGSAGVLDPSAIIRMLDMFKQESKEKILRIYQNFMNELDINFVSELAKLISGNTQYEIMEYIVNFIKRKADSMVREFAQSMSNEGMSVVCRQFGFKDLPTTITDFIENIIDQILNSSGEMMSILKQEFKTWCASLAYNKELQEERKQKRHEGRQKRKIDCKVCGGYYYEI